MDAKLKGEVKTVVGFITPIPIPLSLPAVNWPTNSELFASSEAGFATFEKVEEPFQLLKTIFALLVSKST